MYCNRCGAANPDGTDVRFCRSCGADLANPAAAPGQPYASPPVPPGAPPAYPAPSFPGGVIQASVFPYGGFWIRFVAYLIDTVAAVTITVVLAALLGASMGLGGVRGSYIEMAGSGVGLLVSLVYWIALPPTLGATFGKLAVGYHIVGDDGRHIGWWRALGRYFAYTISTIPLLLGFVWIGIDPQKRGWHDKIAGTYVVRKEFVKP